MGLFNFVHLLGLSWGLSSPPPSFPGVSSITSSGFTDLSMDKLDLTRVIKHEFSSRQCHVGLCFCDINTCCYSASSAVFMCCETNLFW